MEAMEVVWDFLCLLLAVSILAFGLYCCYIKSVHLKYDHIPSVPRVSFFLGHVPLIWGLFKNQKPFHDAFLQWAKKYGPILRFNALHKVIVLVYSPEGIKEFLMSPQYPKDYAAYARVQNMFGVRFLGNGLVSDMNHDHWYKQRRIMDMAFSRSYLIGLMGIFNDKAEDLMKVLDEKADGKTDVNMMGLHSRVTLAIIAKVAFGLELNTLQDDQIPFLQAVYMVMKGIHNSVIPFYKYLPWNRKVVKEIQESVRLLRRTGKECIEQRRKAIQKEEEVPLDILTQILKGAAQEGGCSDELMLDNFVTFFIAGHETSSNQLTFTLMELGRHPEIVTKLQAEVDEVIGMKRDIAYEDLGKLKYLSQVLNEALRLYPPVPAFQRWTGKETIIEEVRIPANTTLMFSSYIMGRMERYFKDPLIFNPDRFSQDQPKHYFSYFPFSLGPRSCIGKVFSQMEAKVVMTKFLQRFEFELVPPQSFNIMSMAALKPSDGLVCRVKPRHQLGCETD